MKLKLLKPVLAANGTGATRILKAGSTLDTEDGHAQQLIKSGHAKVDDGKPDAPAPAPAPTVEQLMAENARLAVECDEWKELAQGCEANLTASAERIADLTAQIEKLKAAAKSGKAAGKPEETSAPGAEQSPPASA